jgi:hypothetical protein
MGFEGLRHLPLIITIVHCTNTLPRGDGKHPRNQHKPRRGGGANRRPMTDDPTKKANRQSGNPAGIWRATLKNR